MTSEQATALEARLAKRPEDLKTRAQLIGYYAIKDKSLEGAAKLKDHVCWWIDHHPGSIVPVRYICLARRNGDEAAILEDLERRWRQQTDRHPAQHGRPRKRRPVLRRVGSL